MVSWLLTSSGIGENLWNFDNNSLLLDYKIQLIKLTTKSFSLHVY